jgi:hypothetical protein
MKRLLTVFATLAFFATMLSCNEVDNDGKTRIIQDSLINVLPTWQALHIKVDDNNTNMRIVVGDATFYKASDDVKNKKKDELAEMVMRIYGKGNYLEKGTLIVTEDIRNKSDTPKDGISIPIDFSAVKKVVFPN